MINQCYEYEAAHTIQDVLSCNGDLNIALVADSHLDNSVPATIENISAVDQAVHFDCCVHLGDFLAGEIGGRYAKLLLRQQPVASDLRIVSSVLKMISDFERIGDQASDIAELAQYIIKSDLPEKIKIKDMASETATMVTDCIDAFVNKDLEGCRNIYKHDDVVDSMFTEIKDEIIRLVQSDNVDGELCIDLLMTAKYLERIADHAVNIAEWVEYSITGTHGVEPVR